MRPGTETERKLELADDGLRARRETERHPLKPRMSGQDFFRSFVCSDSNPERLWEKFGRLARM